MGWQLSAATILRMWHVTHKHEPAAPRPTWAARGANACSGRPVEVPPPGRLPSGDGDGSRALPGRDRCTSCGRHLVLGRFDCVFRYPTERFPTMVWKDERLIYGVPGGLCEDCKHLFIDPELIELLDLGSGRCVFAIESDHVLQEQVRNAE